MIAPSLATSFPLGTGIWISLVCALIGLGAALYLIRIIVGYSPGNETMRRIAGAIEEGAKAYLNRQILSVSVIAVIIFLLLGFTRDFFTAFGFLIGAACSMAAGYIGMRIAVISNCRTAQAATTSTEAALRVAFNGGAVTGLLVVGLGLLSVGIFFLVGQQLFGLEKAISSLVGLALGASLHVYGGASIALSKALPGAFAQVGVHGLARGNGIAGKFVAEVFECEVETGRKFERVANGFGQVGEELLHFLRRLQIALGVA